MKARLGSARLPAMLGVGSGVTRWVSTTLAARPIYRLVARPALTIDARPTYRIEDE